MNESEKRTLLATVLFFITIICLAVTFWLQLDMQNTLAEIASVQLTQAPQTTEEDSAAASVAPPTEESTEASENAVSAEPSVSAIQAKTTAGRTTAERTTEKAETTEKPKVLSERLVVNTNTKKIHSPDCAYAKNIKEENRAEISSKELSEYLDNGYSLCGHCEGCAK